MKCLNCKKEFEPKRITAKFCKDSCRVRYFQKFGKKEKGLTAKQQLNVIYNKILDVLDSGSLSKPIKDDLKATLPIPVQSYHQQVEMPVIASVGSLKIELKDCRTIAEIESVMSKIKSEPLLPRERQQLEAYAKELSKEMYND
jgi:hypothetical protein